MEVYSEDLNQWLSFSHFAALFLTLKTEDTEMLTCVCVCVLVHLWVRVYVFNVNSWACSLHSYQFRPKPNAEVRDYFYILEYSIFGERYDKIRMSLI